MKSSSKPKTNLRDLAIVLPLMVLICTCMVYPFNTELGLNQSFMTVLVTNFLLLGLWTLVFYNNRNMLISLLLFIVAGAFVAVVYFSADSEYGSSTLQASVQAFAYWAGTYLSGFRTNIPLYCSYLLLLISLLFSLVICLFTVRKFSFSAVAICGAACFISMFIIGHTINMPCLYGYLFAAILYFQLHNYKKNSGNKVKQATAALPVYMASALPLAAIVVLLTVILSGAAKIDPVWMKDIRDKILKKDNSIHESIAGVTDTWVVNKDDLGGDLFLNDVVIMQVTSPIANVHLRALSKDYYTGHSWVRTDANQKVIDPAKDISGKVDDEFYKYNLHEQQREKYNQFYSKYKLNINLKSSMSGVIYLPLSTTAITGFESMYRVGSDSYMMADSMGEDVEYTVDFYNPDKSLPEFTALAQSCRKGFFSLNKDADSISFSESELYKQFTQLPDDIPERVKDLAAEITKNAANDYDKAKAIEKYLASNYTYTLKPGYYDNSKDFVDEFLFVGKKRYCTYYATAMAVLLRCVDIPSRYVEGYILPGQHSSANVYNVTKRQGHAWVEAYFEGLGWLTFEPTSSFSTNTTSSNPVNTPSPKPSVRPTPSSTKSAGSKGQPDKAAFSTAVIGNIAIPLLVLSVLIILLAICFIPYKLKYDMIRMKPKEAVLLLFGQYLTLLANQGIRMQNGETSSAVAKRVDEQFHFTEQDFTQSAEIFEQARYSCHEITQSQKEQMLSFRKIMLLASKRKLGFFRYMFYKIIWSL